MRKKIKSKLNLQKKLLVYFFFSVFCASVSRVLEAQQLQVSSDTEIKHDNCLGFCPRGAANDNIVVDHDIVILSSNIKTKFADWVAYKIELDNLKGPQRPRNWKKDPLLNDQITFTPQDYKGLAEAPYLFDRGHQAPLAAFKNHDKWYVVNYLSNITPQKRSLNQGAWNILESKERALANSYPRVYVLTGPYYDNGKKILGPLNKRIDYIIPSGYWKIILVQQKDKIKTIGFIFPQETTKAANYCRYISNTYHIEKVSGLKFANNTSDFQQGGLKIEIGCGRKHLSGPPSNLK